MSQDISDLTLRVHKAQSIDIDPPKPDYFVMLLQSMYAGYNQAIIIEQSKGNESGAMYYRGRKDAISECLEHYAQLNLAGLIQK